MGLFIVQEQEQEGLSVTQRGKNGGIGLLAGCLALALMLASCSGPQETAAPAPIPIAGTGIAAGAGATEYHGPPTDPSAVTTIEPTETISTSSPTVPSGVDMTEDEWQEYIKDDPENARPKEEDEEPVVDTIPSAPPPPKPTTTTAASTTKTTTTTATTSTSGVTATTGTTSSVGTTTTVSGTSDSSAASATTTASTTTTSQSPPDNGWFVKDGKTYYYLNGKPVTGYQTMGGIRYYFGTDGALSSKVGIDVSYAQGTIDWKKVKAAGVDFAFIRVGFRGWGAAGNMKLDAFFEKNIQAAAAVGIDCGVYFFTQAVNVAEAKAEAQFVLEAIRPYTLTYPVVIDTERIGNGEARADSLSKSVRTDVVNAFCDEIKANGYYPMIYADKGWLTYDLEAGRLKADVWLAQYHSTVTYTGAYKIWQYTSSHKLDGITANTVDMNVGLFDYADFIRQNGWNHL